MLRSLECVSEVSLAAAGDTQRLVVVITTCSGRGASLLSALLAQIQQAGWQELVIIVSDGPAPAEVNCARVVDSPATVGQARNYWRALALGLEATIAAAASQFLILEDDVELCANALPYMAKTLVPPELDFVTWFDGHALSANAPRGLHSVPVRQFICMQAVTWPVGTASRLLNNPLLDRWSEPHRGDLLVRQCLPTGRYGICVPNLVEHLGSQSLCAPSTGLITQRVARNYPGPNFDAVTLLGEPARVVR